MKNSKTVIDITGMSKEQVKSLVKLEGYNPNSFYRIWKTKTMRVTIECKK
jgi:hypothetical protein